MQRLADSLLHLLSLTASPTARLVHTAEERGGKEGCMAQFRPHVLLLPLAASLAELVMPLNSARTPPLVEGGAAEEDARVVKVLVSSAAPTQTSWGSANQETQACHIVPHHFFGLDPVRTLGWLR